MLSIKGIKVRSSIIDYAFFYSEILKSINDEATKIITEKFIKSRKASPLVERRLKERNLFKIVAYVIPRNVDLRSDKGIFMEIRSVTNPSVAYVKGKKITLFLRVNTIGSRFNRTFIASTVLNFNELEGSLKIKAKPLLYAIIPYESVEDPRVNPEDMQELYHVRALYLKNEKSIITTVVRLNGKNKPIILKTLVFKGNDKYFLLRDYRDTFALNNKTMIIRPYLRELNSGGIFIAPRKDNVIFFDEMEAPPELQPRNWEVKTGGNCSVKISNNEYLLLYHVVDNYGIYYTYAALLTKSGKLIALSKEPILTPLIGTYCGQRPSTIFVCGAIVYKDKLIVASGRDDEITVFYSSPLQKVLDSLTYIHR